MSLVLSWLEGQQQQEVSVLGCCLEERSSGRLEAHHRQAVVGMYLGKVDRALREALS
jgi:hypothetical protein